jgi:preprotein translocase subunit SecE
MKEKTVNGCLVVFIVIAAIMLLSMLLDLILGVPSI